jgi:hypothetical protein
MLDPMQSFFCILTESAKPLLRTSLHRVHQKANKKPTRHVGPSKATTPHGLSYFRFSCSFDVIPIRPDPCSYCQERFALEQKSLIPVVRGHRPVERFLHWPAADLNCDLGRSDHLYGYPVQVKMGMRLGSAAACSCTSAMSVRFLVMMPPPCGHR